jgi:hypothetical protein
VVEPNVKRALERADLPALGPVPLFHATDADAATRIAATGLMKTDSTGQAWLAISRDIAP